MAHFRAVYTLPLHFLSLTPLVLCSPKAFITPFPALSVLPRQEDLAVTCGYIEAEILSAVGCLAGSTCVADPTQNVAGLCCRLGDNANCAAVTGCVASADLQASCDGDCSSNTAITKCSQADSPYCYTRYWVSAGETPTEIGCTTTQGYSAFVYTTYTVLGGTANFDPATTSPPSSTEVGTRSPAQIGSPGSTTSSSSATTATDQVSNDSSSSANSSDSDSSSSTPVGAIAGGVVGGVVGLGLVAAIIVWIVLQHRRKSRAAAYGQDHHVQQRSGTPPKKGNEKQKPTRTSTGVQSSVSTFSASGSNQQDGMDRRYEIAPNERNNELHEQARVPELP